MPRWCELTENSLSPAPTRCGNTEFRWRERTYVMGILNLTPDSFSGDGLVDNAAAALAQARQMVADGADIIDVGGESTRPGAEPVSTKEEIRRVVPVIERLAGELPVPLSIDTYRAETAYQAVRAGASLINDIWGLKQDPELAAAAAELGVPVILTSNQRDISPGDIMADVIATLEESIRRARDAGIAGESIIIDPGVGFGKSVPQNLEIIHRLAELRVLGKPVLLGTSRKSVIGKVLDQPPDQRLEGTAATVAIGIANGADMVRVHDVPQMVRVCRMSDAILGKKPVVG